MKKVLVVLTLVLLVVPLITAQGLFNPELKEDVENTKEIIDNVRETIDEIKSGSLELNSLEEEWSLLFYETPAGETILYFNPFIRIIIGMNFTLSRLFLLTLFIWVALFLIIYRLSTIPWAYIPKTPRIPISILLIVAFSWIGGTKAVSLSIMAIVNSISSGFIKGFTFIILIFLLLVIIVYSKALEEIALRISKERRLKKIEKRTKRTEKMAESIAFSGRQKTEEEEIEEQVRSEIQGMSDEEL
ncbi:hypothetical protein COU62_00250 [Candidatus Pacearchaeota archaeon CG10_big_fil_rev_8_21_14_0_10_35_219]|nr:hypothetical protein [Candidatus Pacearchaeota archaeon]OIO42481.1 MAG: hypothetical protein AUJ63_02675 [Candidatus Pacearchaeota archaeon CG1_02_35_32]PIO08414.1 MAG: hypothetical protein COU62_00250 [Candidatus Pacearchaeota archaeon CG10_big_fil_rev_8_21_14_0_10_35_219]PIY81823.1 MAG: hypothetical protein COY79_00785 [Candidatus Pacearchaeota archaeon CG_4_10_14_0_8_um_filter_35_169]PIZ80059.1 MAG: hypothetical protein COY00_02210 [Candidatus Pacearchaeota archaeon CG_4_10_14_0_2_um_filt